MASALRFESLRVDPRKYPPYEKTLCVNSPNILPPQQPPLNSNLGKLLDASTTLNNRSPNGNDLLLNNVVDNDDK